MLIALLVLLLLLVFVLVCTSHSYVSLPLLSTYFMQVSSCSYRFNRAQVLAGTLFPAFTNKAIIPLNLTLTAVCGKSSFDLNRRRRGDFSTKLWVLQFIPGMPFQNLWNASQKKRFWSNIWDALPLNNRSDLSYTYDYPVSPYQPIFSDPALRLANRVQSVIHAMLKLAILPVEEWPPMRPKEIHVAGWNGTENCSYR